MPENDASREQTYQDYVRLKIEQAREEVRAGNVVSQEEAEERMAKWLDEREPLTKPGPTGRENPAQG